MNRTDTLVTAQTAFNDVEIKLLDAIVGESSAADQIREFVLKASLSSSTVLITGESGTGKELIAQSIHTIWSAYMHRVKRTPPKPPFVPVNCGAIPETLIETELFGYERGAFSGATYSKSGLIEAADQGTLFLDEIADLPASCQVKLNRFLREGEMRRIGSTKPKQVRARVIAATNKNLYRELGQNFREDLYYRLNIFPLEIPPLRQRLLDIPLLVENFFKFYNLTSIMKVESVDSEVCQKLQELTWPGNIQQLHNVLERAAVNSDAWISELEDVYMKRLTPADFYFLYMEAPYNETAGGLANVDLNLPKIERSYITEAMRRASDNTVSAAQILGISKHSLRRRLRELRLNK